MQVSGWMYLAQQGLSAACLLLSLSRAAQLGRIFPLRMAVTSLLLALSCLLGAQQPSLRCSVSALSFSIYAL